MRRQIICPNSGSCLVYKIYYTNIKGKYQKDKAKADCIEDDGKKYSCVIIDHLSSDRRVEILNEQNPTKTECALIKLLNNSRALLDLSSKVK